MRVTNKMLSNNFLRDMRTNLNNMNTLQGQMTSGKQIRKASDDPFKASRIMQMYSDIDANKQYKTNIKDAINWLDTTDTALGQVGNVAARVEELLIAAGNGAYSPNERRAIRDEINEKVGELSQILNTSFDGKYIFGGVDGTSKPVGTDKNAEGNTELICNIKPKVITKIEAGTGTMLYDGKTLATGTEFNISLNGGAQTTVTIDPDSIKSGETSMATVASILEAKINDAIQPSAVTVTATADGGFEISPAGTLTFSDIGKGTTTKDLGLSDGANKLLVEVSQGVNMEYNITASQVINYGKGDNENLIQLLKNITTHLGADADEVGADPALVAAKIKALTAADLTGIKAVMTNILKLRSEVGAKQNRMESAESRNIDGNFNMMEILSRTEDIDITEKTMEYATMQTIYVASLQTSAKVLQPSLLDYLR